MPIACPLCSAELNLHNMQLLEAVLGSSGKPCAVQDEASVNHTALIQYSIHLQTHNAGRGLPLLPLLGSVSLDIVSLDEGIASLEEGLYGGEISPTIGLGAPSASYAKHSFFQTKDRAHEYTTAGPCPQPQCSMGASSII